MQFKKIALIRMLKAQDIFERESVFFGSESSQVETLKTLNGPTIVL